MVTRSWQIFQVRFYLSDLPLACLSFAGVSFDVVGRDGSSVLVWSVNVGLYVGFRVAWVRDGLRPLNAQIKRVLCFPLVDRPNLIV